MDEWQNTLPSADPYAIRDEESIPSPALVFYLEPLRHNIATMVEIAGGPERLRPHIKTHKCPAVVRECIDAGITRYKCAGIAEARMLAETGVEDIVIAYQLNGPDIPALHRLRMKFPAARIMPVVDNVESMRKLSDPENPVEVLLDLNVGMDRTGIHPGEGAVRLYRLLSETDGVTPGGLHAYDGHVTESIPSVRKAKADMIYSLVRELADRLESDSLTVPRIIMGGTPTFPCHAPRPDVELSPGTCVLHDGGYLAKFGDLDFQPAALVFSRVASVPYPGRMTIDCGAKSIGTDPPGGPGVILNCPGASPVKLSEEHWSFDLTRKQAVVPGDPVYILPNHICTTVAHYAEAFVIGARGELIDTWPISARDRSYGI